MSGKWQLLFFIGLVLLLVSSVGGCKPYTQEDIEQDYQQHFIQGNAYLDQEQWDEAIAEYTKAIELNPEFAEAYANRAVARLEQLEYNLAGGNEYNFVIADCEKAVELNPIIKLNPRLALAYAHRGDYYLERRDYDKAVANYTRAIEIDPSVKCRRPVDVYSDLAGRYLSDREYDKAIMYFNKAIELDSGDNEYFYRQLAKAYSGRGLQYLEYWEPDEAIADFTKAIELDPDEADYYSYRGGVYSQLVDYYWDAGQVFEVWDSNMKAIADFTKAIELAPERAEVYFTRGQCYAGNGDYIRAITDFTKAIELGREEWFVYFNRASAYKELGSKDEAVADYRRAIALTEVDFVKEQSLKAMEELQAKTEVKEASDFFIEVVSLTSPVCPGAYATIEVKTLPNELLAIEVYYKSGKSEAMGLSPKRADDEGNIRWTWKVDTRTTPGRWRIVIASLNMDWWFKGYENITKTVYFEVK